MKRIIASLRARNVVTIVIAGIFAALVVGGGSAYAAHLITSRDIQDGTIQKVDLSKAVKDELGKQGAQGPRGPMGPRGYNGHDGADGKDAMFGAVYRVAHYSNGGGGRATVACADTVEESMKYTAISGGAHVEVPAGHTNTEPITSSFPGRMDWDGPDNQPGGGDDNQPYPNRLDGWIVNFGNGDAPGADGLLEVWALCVPTTDIPVESTTY